MFQITLMRILVLELLGFCLIWLRFVSDFDIRISDFD